SRSDGFPRLADPLAHRRSAHLVSRRRNRDRPICGPRVPGRLIGANRRYGGGRPAAPARRGVKLKGGGTQGARAAGEGGGRGGLGEKEQERERAGRAPGA